VPGKIIAAMRSAAVSIGLVSEGRFELGLHGMAIVTETLLVTHAAYLRLLPGHGPMFLSEIYGMVESAENHAVCVFIVTFGADRPLVA